MLDIYAKGELSASRASQMLGIPRATFYSLLTETNIPLPEKLNQSIKGE
jgi:predicted DNA-binding transcriptional regulator AlpA